MDGLLPHVKPEHKAESSIGKVVKYLKDSGLREKYYVVVGGGPITPQWTTQIGADGHARLAVDTGQLLKRLVTEGKPSPISPTPGDWILMF